MTDTISPVLGEATVQELREALRGEVLTPADDGYAAACHVWNGAHDARRPALIARCTGAADVIAAVGFARSNDLPIAVRGGAHSIAGSRPATAASSSTCRRCGPSASTRPGSAPRSTAA